MSDTGKIVTVELPEWLPAGWTLESKVLRSGRQVDMYTNKETGKRLFSKDDVLHYIKMEYANCGNPQSTDKSLERDSEINSSLIINENEHPEWLPKDWKMVVKARCSGKSMGRKYKIFIDPLNGHRFFSKPEVIRYLTTEEQKSCRPRYLQTVKHKKKSISEKKSSGTGEQPVSKVLNDVEGLPPGWIKKIKVRSFDPSKKDPFYIDPVNGYVFRSKKDVMRYLKTGDINQCAYRPKKMRSNDQDLTSDEKEVAMYTNKETGKRLFSKDDVLHYIKMEYANCGNPQSTDKSLERDSEINSSLIINENEHPEWLPKDWKMVVKARCSGKSMGRKYKIFIDPLNGHRFFSKPEVIRYLTTEEQKSCRPRYLQTVKHKKKSISEKKSSGTGEQPVSKVMSDVEGLPPGWIKKIKVRSFDRSKKDPFYIDPVNGYVFRSKKDVMRYLKTGDINQCAYRPKKMCSNDQDLTSDEKEVASSSTAKKQKLNHPASRRQLFADETNSETSIVALSKAEGNFGSNDPCAARADILQQKLMLENSVHESAETKQNCASDSSLHLEAETSKITPGIRNIAETGHDSTPAPDILQEDSLVGKTHIKSSKSKEKKLLSLSRRCSKRLAGLEPYDVVKPFPAEKAREDIIEKSGTVEATQYVSLMANNLVNVASQQPEAGQGTELPYPASIDVNTSLCNIPSNKSMMPLKMVEVEKRDTEKPEQKLNFLFDSDPCLEFAFKTLTGELPVTDTADNGPICYPSADILESKYSLDSEMKNCHRAKLQYTSSKSRRCKERNLPYRSSKRLAGLEPEPLEIGATGAADWPKTGIENYAYSNISTSGEPWNKTKSPKDPIVTREQPQMLGTQSEELEKFKPQLSFSLGNCQSDLSYDFSYKTLTGAMPMDDSLLQGRFKEQLNSSQNQKDNRFFLPDYSSFSFFRSDVSSSFDTSLGSVSSQQNSQEQFLESKKDFPGR